MEKVFVTGGAGFIGSHLVDALLAMGATVVVYDNFCTGRTEFVPQNSPKLQVIRGDTLDLPALKAAGEGCDFIFHFQANADVRGGRDNPRVDLEQNTIATWNVLEMARVHGANGFAFASSAAVYGEPEVFPTPENYASHQTSLYGASKLAGEAMIEAYCEYYNMRCFSYRFVSWIGERYTHGIVFDVLKKLQRDPKCLPLFGDGTQKKSYLYVKDGVAGVMRGIEKSSAQKNVFNLGHDYFITVVEVVKIILDELRMNEVKLEFAGGKRGWLGDSPLVHLDTSKIKQLGWQPETSIEEGIRRTVRFLKQNPQLLQRA
ncbi:MAG: NAD-dependent epimerase/dehydratase family protein [Verrucomicrobiales bacterium]|nr:NAD-dependent epimerase/dehydratase family protein [Verrucomicrobiales bacterium]